MKKFICMVISVILFTACSMPDVYTDHPIQSMSQDEIINEVLRCFDEDDTTKLKELFCPKTIENVVALDEQIKTAMEFYDGKHLSYDDIIVNGRAAKSASGFDPVITGLMTDTGKRYYIWINSYVVNAHNPEYVGISSISVKLMGADDSAENTYVEVGEYIE
ncbi:MAG: DUF5104 domain-containing protein [Oscillospiraceae bacterium]|nr:DUF5104 domain-containing protein [Oscillospiraceae bacterium]